MLGYFVIHSKYLFFILISAFSFNALASNIVVGKKLPALNITDGGDLHFNNNGQRQFRTWSTNSLKNHKKIIQYMPGRLSSKENLGLNAAVYNIDHPHRCRTVSIVNYMDAIWGTWIFIEPEMARNKKLTPLCDVVLDKAGVGQITWGLDLDKNNTIVTNEEGIVIFFHAGKLSKQHIEHIVKITNPPGIKATISDKKTPVSH
jgi:YtfJ family uncharacterized protein